LATAARADAFSPDYVQRYIEAWSQPGAVTAMINYYRAAFHRAPTQVEPALRPVTAPTRIIWGERDRYLGKEYAEPDRADVPNLEQVIRLPDVSHWVQHDKPDQVTSLLVEFFRSAAAVPARSGPQPSLIVLPGSTPLDPVGRRPGRDRPQRESEGSTRP
jgi:pimeloyl-ACP methyl ester carboxylesterase